jgi:hypothetical protein
MGGMKFSGALTWDMNDVMDKAMQRVGMSLSLMVAYNKHII